MLLIEVNCTFLKMTCYKNPCVENRGEIVDHLLLVRLLGPCVTSFSDELGCAEKVVEFITSWRTLQGMS